MQWPSRGGGEVLGEDDPPLSFRTTFEICLNPLTRIQFHVQRIIRNLINEDAGILHRIMMFYYMASNTSGEMKDCYWLRSTFSGTLFSCNGPAVHYAKTPYNKRHIINFFITPYNKLFINLACSVCTDKYCTSVILYKSRPTGSVYTKKTLVRYFSVQASCSVNKKLLIERFSKLPEAFYICSAFT